MQKNTFRFDLSDYLIHFFRNIDITSSNAPYIPEYLGFTNIYEDTKLSALFMLRCAIRQSKLWATWSYRNNVRTIYGHNPAVCFTEMPLAAFLEAGQTRAERGEAMSQFALVFPKHALFSLGANPVIYGLDDRNAFIPSGKGGDKRIINASLLPEQEQYRYVTYNPCGNRPVDWSHEREWRWAYRGDLTYHESEIEEYGIISDTEDMMGLQLNDDTLCGMGVVVQTKEQAQWVIYDILSLVDRGVISVHHYKFVLCINNLPDNGTLRNPIEVSNTIRKSMIDLEPFFLISQTEAESFDNELFDMVNLIEDAYPEIENGEFGGAWLWLLDNTHKFTRGLLYTGTVTVSNDGRYLARLYLNDGRSLRQREEMIKKLAKMVSDKFGIECGYFSVLNSDDINDVPFYCDDHLDNHMFYNISLVSS